ncbi:carbohydrate kinase family protein [Zhouia amylolytica]|uniref:Fructokinase n=1 Tax=Zhouia amylolytica AD3 TaxID=1286632 RepID=W2UN18_9FLAO|nr:carbohydrate kinase [Zhouia amylolytica]ETN94727.1 fructokinase [Zhouia amylolytica AD3]
MSNTLKGVSFGEILWDVFPDKKKIGGAPLNVALRMQSLGCNMSMISAVGDDTDGQRLISFLQENKVETHEVQIRQELVTGSVTVTLDKRGTASYSINHPAAWDKIVLTKTSKETVKNADVIVFGSLVCRDKTSRETLLALLEIAPFKAFDVNLRPPHYSFEILQTLMEQADFIKFNDEELLELSQYMGSTDTEIKKNILFISEKTDTASICVTKGSAGAELYWNGTFYAHPGYSIDVVDTVGAGDSFLGALLTHLLNNVSPGESLDYACAIGALVASRQGANPKLTSLAIESLRRK